MTEHCITQQAQFITQFTIINNELHFTFKTHFPNASLFSLQPHMLKHLQHIYCNNHIQLCMDTTLLVHFRFTCVSLTTSMIPSSNRIQNGDILVQANPGEPRKWLLKWRERLVGLLCPRHLGGALSDDAV